MPPKQGKPTSPILRKTSDFVDPGGGATPRPRENPQILLNTKVPPKPISSDKFKLLIKKLDDFKKLDSEDFSNSAEMCQFIDFYNDTVIRNRQTEYEKEITARNEYYWKLWIRAMDESR